MGSLLRVGRERRSPSVSPAGWDISAFVDNATNELARLALDRERGTLARIGYLTNPPRTIGLATRVTF